MRHSSVRTSLALLGLLVVTGSAVVLSIRAHVPAYASVFSDVPATDPASVALDDLHTRGIVDGYPDGTFRPNNTINRAEFVKILEAAVTTQQDRFQCFLTYQDAV